jgi:hypothetical protein
MKKLCKDCKWYRKDWIENILFRSSDLDMCASPNTSHNHVTGYDIRFCDMLRAERWKELDYSCGPEGKFWEAKR